MDDKIPQGHESAAAEGHEPYSLVIRPIFVFGGVLTVVVVATMAALAAMMGLFKAEEKTLDASRPALYDDQTGQYPLPRLQRNYTQDMKLFREEEAAALSNYGWVDPEAGIARIPIDRALSIIAERGLPKVQARAPETAAPVAAEPETK